MFINKRFIFTFFILLLFVVGCSSGKDPCVDGYLNSDGSLIRSDVNKFGNCHTVPKKCGDPLY